MCLKWNSLSHRPLGPRTLSHSALHVKFLRTSGGAGRAKVRRGNIVISERFLARLAVVNVFSYPQNSLLFLLHSCQLQTRSTQADGGKKGKNHSKWLSEKVNKNENGKLSCQWCFIELTLNHFAVVFVYFFPLCTSFLSWRISLESNQRSHISDQREAGKNGENAHIRCSAAAMNLPNARRRPAKVSFFRLENRESASRPSRGDRKRNKIFITFDCEH